MDEKQADETHTRNVIEYLANKILFISESKIESYLMDGPVTIKDLVVNVKGLEKVELSEFFHPDYDLNSTIPNTMTNADVFFRCI